MAKKDAQQKPPSPLSQALKIYRDQHKFTQEELANLLDVEPRTLRRWENNETILTDINELKRIADRLGIPHEHLGIAASIYVPLTVERIHTIVSHVWELIDQARIREARTIIENLAQEASHQIAVGDPVFVRALAQLYHAAGHSVSLSARTEEVGSAIYYYQQMEYFARLLNDQTLLNLSLAYQGDMQRRKGDFSRAIICLEEARDSTPDADVAARGNAIQLLGRAYLRAGRVADCEYAIHEAEELAHQTHQQENSTKGRYNLAMVYEEYAKSYGIIGKMQLALDYLDQAEKVRPPTKTSEILLKVTRSEILIKDGDIHNGTPLAIEAAIHCRTYGHYRRLERIYALKRHLNHQALRYNKAELALSEALEGPIEL